MTPGSREKMASANLILGYATLCFFIGFDSSFAVSLEEPPSLAEEDFSCVLRLPNQILSCSWPLKSFPDDSAVELLYWPTKQCSISVPFNVSCENKPPCEIWNIQVTLCSYYNVSMKVISMTSGGSELFVLPWKEFFLPSISKISPTSVEVKARYKTCITLEWPQDGLEPAFGNETYVIQFRYASQWEPSQVETSNLTFTLPRSELSFSLDQLPALPAPGSKKLCRLTPSTQYRIEMRIRPSASRVWSDAYTVNGSTTDSVPARSPPSISGAFKRVSSNATIIYWKLLTEKEWQSDSMERTYHLFVKNSSSEIWQPLMLVDWNVSQAKIPLFEEEDTIIKLQAHNLNGYAEKYSKITIPFSGPPTPTNVSAVIDEAEKKVKFSWDSDFNEEVVLFWCLWESEYQCLENSIDWRLQKNVSIQSVILPIEDLEPLSHYMFGVSVSHLNISSGMTMTRCKDEQNVYRSNCNSTQSPNNKVNENETSKTLVIVLVSVFTTVLVIVVILAIVLWWKVKWSRKSKYSTDGSKLYQAKPNSENRFRVGNGDPPLNNSQDYDAEAPKENDKSSEASTSDTEKDHYCKVGMEMETGFTSKDIDTDKNENSWSDESSGNLSDFSCKSSTDGDSNEAGHYKQPCEEGRDSGTSSRSEFFDSNFNTDNFDSEMKKINNEEGRGHANFSHYHNTDITTEEDEDTSGTSHYHARKVTAREDEDSGDTSHYHTS